MWFGNSNARSSCVTGRLSRFSPSGNKKMGIPEPIIIPGSPIRRPAYHPLHCFAWKGRREKGRREKGRREKGRREKGRREKGRREKGRREKGRREKGREKSRVYRAGGYLGRDTERGEARFVPRSRVKRLRRHSRKHDRTDALCRSSRDPPVYGHRAGPNGANGSSLRRNDSRGVVDRRRGFRHLDSPPRGLVLCRRVKAGSL